MVQFLVDGVWTAKQWLLDLADYGSVDTMTYTMPNNSTPTHVQLSGLPVNAWGLWKVELTCGSCGPVVLMEDPNGEGGTVHPHLSQIGRRLQQTPTPIGGWSAEDAYRRFWLGPGGPDFESNLTMYYDTSPCTEAPTMAPLSTPTPPAGGDGQDAVPGNITCELRAWTSMAMSADSTWGDKFAEVCGLCTEPCRPTLAFGKPPSRKETQAS
jgi:hypothetical protein